MKRTLSALDGNEKETKGSRSQYPKFGLNRGPRRNHTYGTRGTRPVQLWRSWGPSVFVPSNFCNWLSLFRRALWEAYRAPQTSLLNSRGEGNKSSRGGNGRTAKHEWSNIGRRGRDGRGKGMGSTSTDVRSPPTAQPWLSLWPPWL